MQHTARVCAADGLHGLAPRPPLLEETHLLAANLEADGRCEMQMRVPRTMQDFKGPDCGASRSAAASSPIL